MTLKVPLSTLRIFEAAARHRSFRAAATELCLTPSAVSHAVRKMEEALGVVLFERSGRSVRLSPEGEVLMNHTERAFEELRLGLELVSARTPYLLRLHSAPSFPAQWLTPRLSRFFAEHIGVDVRLLAGVDYARFDTDEFDADVIYGPPRQQGLVVIPLCEETITLFALQSSPIGTTLFISTSVTKCSLAETSRELWPFFAVAMLVLLGVSYIPALTIYSDFWNWQA